MNNIKKKSKDVITYDESSIRRFLVVSKEDGHEYDILVKTVGDEIEYKIHASKNGIWQEKTKGELFLTMIDTGNGIKFIRVAGKLINLIDYDEATHMRILLIFRNNFETHNRESFDIVEWKEVMKV